MDLQLQKWIVKTLIENNIADMVTIMKLEEGYSLETVQRIEYLDESDIVDAFKHWCLGHFRNSIL